MATGQALKAAARLQRRHLTFLLRAALPLPLLPAVWAWAWA
jgi:hypothetical protein